MARTGIVKDERYMNHVMGAYHPESPQRLEVIYAMLEDPDMVGNFQEIPVSMSLWLRHQDNGIGPGPYPPRSHPWTSEYPPCSERWSAHPVGTWPSRERPSFWLKPYQIVNRGCDRRGNC